MAQPGSRRHGLEAPKKLCPPRLAVLWRSRYLTEIIASRPGDLRATPPLAARTPTYRSNPGPWAYRYRQTGMSDSVLNATLQHKHSDRDDAYIHASRATAASAAASRLLRSFGSVRCRLARVSCVASNPRDPVASQRAAIKHQSWSVLSSAPRCSQ